MAKNQEPEAFQDHYATLGLTRPEPGKSLDEKEEGERLNLAYGQRIIDLDHEKLDEKEREKKKAALEKARRVLSRPELRAQYDAEYDQHLAEEKADAKLNIDEKAEKPSKEKGEEPRISWEGVGRGAFSALLPFLEPARDFAAKQVKKAAIGLRRNVVSSVKEGAKFGWEQGGNLDQGAQKSLSLDLKKRPLSALALPLTLPLRGLAKLAKPVGGLVGGVLGLPYGLIVRPVVDAIKNTAFMKKREQASAEKAAKKAVDKKEKIVRDHIEKVELKPERDRLAKQLEALAIRIEDGKNQNLPAEKLDALTKEYLDLRRQADALGVDAEKSKIKLKNPTPSSSLSERFNSNKLTQEEEVLLGGRDKKQMGLIFSNIEASAGDTNFKTILAKSDLAKEAAKVAAEKAAKTEAEKIKPKLSAN